VICFLCYGVKIIIGDIQMSCENNYFYYRDIAFCLEDVKGVIIKHKQSEWYLEIFYNYAVNLSYMCRHKDEAQMLFKAILDKLGAKEIIIEKSY
jgi:hypothetical protein